MNRIYDMTCDGLFRPVGIDSLHPRFNWKTASDKNETFQEKIKLEVCDEQKKTVWNFEKTGEKQPDGIVYGGESLESAATYFWRVEMTDRDGELCISEWKPFTTGILDKTLWTAKWIQPTVERKPCRDSTSPRAAFAASVEQEAPLEELLNPPVYFKRVIRIEKTVKKAMLFATAHGIYSLYLDGEKISCPLAPGYSNYSRYMEYQTCDVTAALSVGEHCIGSIVADGWYAGKIGLMGVGNQYGDQPAFLMQLHVAYEDGTECRIVSDESFRWKTGAYRYADLFVGECCDAARTPDDFADTQPPDGSWAAVCAQKTSGEEFRGKTAEDVEILREFHPVQVIQNAYGEQILDAGENIAGYVRFCAAGKKGQRITLEYSEILDQEQRFYKNIVGQNKDQTDIYIFAEDGQACYEPQFTFHGFRYVKVSGMDQVRAGDFTVTVLGTDLKKSGSFLTSNPELNQLQENIFRSQQGNMLSVPTDCPQRERAGWTGDMQIYAPTACFNMDCLSFLGRWLAIMRLEQGADGKIPNVIPRIPSNVYMDSEEEDAGCSAGWGDACIIVPYVLYRSYGDTKMLAENYPMMLRWMQYIERSIRKHCRADDPDEQYLWRCGHHFGDWMIPSMLRQPGGVKLIREKTAEEASTAMYANSARLMEEISDVLGEKEKAAHYRGLHSKISQAFMHAFVREDGRMRTELQGLYVLAVHTLDIPDEIRTGFVCRLKQLIVENGYHLDTGFLSVPYLLDVLYENGERELASRILFQTTPPSWLYEVRQGATTIWERWEAIRPDGERTQSSYNHFAFGCVGDFMYRRIAGIRQLEAGYREILIEPDFSFPLQWVRAEYDCPCGKIRVCWEKREGSVHTEIDLPPDTCGVLRVQGEEYRIGNGHYESDWKENVYEYH